MQSDLHIKNKTATSEEVFGKSFKKLKKKKVLLNDTNLRETNEKTKNMWKELQDLQSQNNIINDKNQDHPNSDNFFCNLPNSAYARVIISTSDLVDLEEKDLWSTDGILAQCHIDDVLRANAHFTSLCQMQEGNGAEQKCCRSWSPANYVALLSNRSSCLGVTENDLSNVKALLQKCADYYHNHQLLPNCEEDLHCQKHVPSECYAKNAVYHLLHYLLDVDFILSSVSVCILELNITIDMECSYSL